MLTSDPPFSSEREFKQNQQLLLLLLAVSDL